MFDCKVLSREDVERTLDIASVVRSNEEVYRQRSLGQTDTWPTVFTIFQEGSADLDIKSGWLKGSNIFGHKTMGWYKENEGRGLPALVGMVCVFDSCTGAPIGIVDGSFITGIRTGAAGGIGAKLLARPDSETLLIVGAGAQSVYQAASTLTLMPNLKRVLISNPHNPDLALKKAAVLPSEVEALGVASSDISFESSPDIKSACGAADIIITCTMSRQPLVEQSWIAPGTHFSCIGADMEGKIEIDPQITASARLFTDDTEHCCSAGEIEVGLKEGIFNKDHIVGEIGDILTGKVEGRNSDDQITVFDATGMALLDIACAKAAIDKANELCLGTTVSF